MHLSCIIRKYNILCSEKVGMCGECALQVNIINFRKRKYYVKLCRSVVIYKKRLRCSAMYRIIKKMISLLLIK